MTKIPKKIHYCWIGGNEKPVSVQHCINTWKKNCPDYEIIEWNESNYDFTKNLYMKQAFECKKWAFVTDYARLDIVNTHGGVYLDTDVELIKSMDSLLNNEAFFGFENSGTNNLSVNTGHGFGAVSNHYVLRLMLEYYNDLCFILPDGTLNLQPCPYYVTECLKQVGLKLENIDQDLKDIKIYESDVFCPKNYKTKKLNISERTIGIHHFSTSWLTENEKRKRKISNYLDFIVHIPNMIVLAILGKENYRKLKKKLR